MTAITTISAAALAPSSRPRVGWQRLLIALVQSGLLYWLNRACADRIWPATVPVLLVPLVLVLVLGPVMLIVNLGHLAPRRLALWGVAATLLVAALGLYDASSTVLLPGERSSPSVLPSIALVAALFIAQTLVAAASPASPDYFVVAWKLAGQLTSSVGFAVVVWLMVILASELFRLIGLDFIARLLSLAWFSIVVFACSFACAIHLTDVRPDMVSGQGGLMLLVACLLPVAPLLAGGFLLSLPYTSLAPHAATGHGAAVLLLLAAALLVALLNARWQHREAFAGLARAVHWSARMAALLLLPLMLVTAWALYLRVQQYGWTGPRAVAAAWLVGASCFAGRFFLAALRRRPPARLPSMV
jgi:hypothetical protein